MEVLLLLYVDSREDRSGLETDTHATKDFPMEPWPVTLLQIHSTWQYSDSEPYTLLIF